MSEEKKLADINIDETVYETGLTTKYSKRKTFVPKSDQKVYSAIPGTVRNIFVKKGDYVKEGDDLLILEAMKMENHIIAPISGFIKTIHVESDQMLAKGHLMIELD